MRLRTVLHRIRTCSVQLCRGSLLIEYSSRRLRAACCQRARSPAAVRARSAAALRRRPNGRGYPRAHQGQARYASAKAPLTRPRVAPEVGPIGALRQECCSGPCARVLALYVRPDTCDSVRLSLLGSNHYTIRSLAGAGRLQVPTSSPGTKEPALGAARISAMALIETAVVLLPPVRAEVKTPRSPQQSEVQRAAESTGAGHRSPA